MNNDKYNYDYPENRQLGKGISGGDGSFICELTGYSPAYVSQVLNGKRRNEIIMIVAKDLISLKEIIKKVHKKRKLAES